MKLKIVAAFFGFLIACGDSTPSEPDAKAQCAQPFENTVEAAAWAKALSPTQRYRYSHDLSTQIADIGLAGTESSIRMWQVYDHESIPDGALRAELGELSLTTTGRSGPGLQHEVHATLSDGTQSAQIIARFSHERCFDPSDGADAPACAGSLKIGGGILLPSCGLIADNVVLSGMAPVLRELEYRVPVTDSSTDIGGRAVDDHGEWHVLSVKNQARTLPATDVAAWLSEVAADELFLDSNTILLTTAFLDRTWWREMDRQIAQCSFVAAGGMNFSQPSGCNGDYCADDWNQGSGQNSGNNAWGDPHMTSLDGHAFDFQAAGEFVLSRSTAGEPLEIQMRTEPLQGGPLACRNASTVQAVAAKIGQTRIMFQHNSIWVDGAPWDPSASIAVPEGGALTLDTDKSVIRWSDGSELWVRSRGSLSLGFTPAPERANKLEGVLGNFDANTTNDFGLPDGEVIPMPASFHDIHRTFAEAWRVTNESSLFDYESGQDTSTFIVDGFPGAALTLKDFPAADVENARATCLEQGVEHPAAMTGCIIDIACEAGPVSDITSAAADQPLPTSAQAPGEDVATGGAIERVNLPERLDDSAWPQPEAVCEPRMRKNISLFLESRGATLATDIGLAANGPGRYDNDAKLSPSTLASGRAVDTWLLHRAPGPTGEAPLQGFVRFDRRIVGVVVGSNALSATDSSLGAGIIYEVGNARGIELGSGPRSDWFEISADGKQVRVQLVGDDPDQIRVLTEVQ